MRQFRANADGCFWGYYGKNKICQRNRLRYSVAILLIAFIYRLGLSNVGKLELMIYVIFFSLALVHLLKRNKKK